MLLSQDALIKDLADPKSSLNTKIRCLMLLCELGRKAYKALPHIYEILRKSKSIDHELNKAAAQAIVSIDESIPDEIKVNLGNFQNFSDSLRASKPKTKKKFKVYEKYSQVEKTIEPQRVKFKPINSSNRYYIICKSCEKTIDSISSEIKFYEKTKKPYCSFCQCNGLYDPKQKQTKFLFSYKGIISYYYYCYYKEDKVYDTNRPAFYEMEGYLEKHREISNHPSFIYDNSSFNWIIDFTLVDLGVYTIEDILREVAIRLVPFEIPSKVPYLDFVKFYKKFEKRILEFYKTREQSSRAFVPSFAGCILGTTSVIDYSCIRTFDADRFVEKSYKKNATNYYNGEYAGYD